MKRTEYFKLIADLFAFKTISDEKGNEYVLFSMSQCDSIRNIEDKTAFEAIENHVHLLERIKKQEFENLISVAKILGQTLANSLKIQFPAKNFYVYVSLRLHDSMIIRFHQKWENEEPYYDLDTDIGNIEKVFRYEI